MLKSLELFGFKSFADRTVFEFDAGITCVVGPNGSGKSNVVDAIKWILGDQSAKSLRGQEMSDVIFNGSAGRRGSGFAEATLTFDNHAGLFPLDVPEVQIGRRLYQSGDSEYLLNQIPVRLKDIRDVFMGTGAGTAAYSIIEQGRVDQILQPNPATRRMVFEEAAGISKFKARRIEAERRLERVAQTLLRLTDIVQQTDSQLQSTRLQASKAAKYQEISRELKAAWTGLAADDCRAISVVLDAYLTELEELEERFSGIHGHFEVVESRKTETDDRLAEYDQRLQESEKLLSSLRETIARHEATMRHQTIRREELAAEQIRLSHQRLSLSKLVELSRQEFEATHAQLLQFEEILSGSNSQFSQRQAEFEELERLVAERREVIELHRQDLVGLTQQRSEVTERLTVLASQSEHLNQLKEQSAERLSQLQAEMEVAQNGLSLCEVGLKEAEQALLTRQEQLTDAEQSHWKTLQQREETEKQIQTLKERRSGADARLSVLEELEQKQEGIAIGVQEILKRAETARTAPWDRILGTVRDLLEVPMDLAPIIDAALGERSQLIAVSDLDPLLDYLDRGLLSFEGRVGFVSISADEVEGHPELDNLQINLSQVDFTGIDGVYGRADRLVQSRDRAPNLTTRVLGDTWIVETLDVARKLVTSGAYGQRFVTLQGELLTSGRQLYVGVMPHETSIVSRKSELRSLKNEIQQFAKGIEAALERQSLLSETLTSRSTLRKKLSEELKKLSNAVTENATQLTSQQREVDRLQREIDLQVETQDSIGERELQAKQTFDELKIRSTELTDQMTLIESELSEFESSIEDVLKLLAETQQAIRIEQVDFANQEERLRGLRQTQTRLNRDQQQRIQQLEDAVTRVSEIRDQRCRCDLQYLKAQNQVAELCLQREQIQKETRQLFKERTELRELRQSLQKSEGLHHQERQHLVDRKHKLEVAVQRQRMQLQSLSDRIQEEFQMTLEQLVDSEVSAYRDYVESLTAQQTAQQAEEAVEQSDSEIEEGNSPDSLEELNNTSIPSFQEVRAELEANVERLRRKLKALGSVNTEALHGLQELEERHQALSLQLQDLQESKTKIEEIIRFVNHESQRIFLESFETIRGHFQILFRKLFGGGDADIILEDPNDVLECGIDIVARPPGKELRSISLLSGGEKTMTAVGMLFAMFKSKPSPYCILDEVDAALDEANVDRYVNVLKEFVQMTQFVVITHRKRTMTAANVLYGVTMEQAGVSKRIAVKFDDVNDNGEIRSAA